jgi:hypothetical protein
MSGVMLPPSPYDTLVWTGTTEPHTANNFANNNNNNNNNAFLCYECNGTIATWPIADRTQEHKKN